MTFPQHRAPRIPFVCIFDFFAKYSRVHTASPVQQHLGIQMAPEHMASVGLFIGQRHRLFVPGTKGSGWYNERGDWFGWGDLTNQNMVAIAQTLKPEQLFIVLHEEDAFRRFLRNVLPDLSRVARSEDAPGLDYVMHHALFVIAQGEISRVHDVHPRRPPEVTGGIAYRIVECATARAIMLAHSPSVDIAFA